jgi:4-diphosphocytidyl-2-C-methyl-D-erythritol kinase
VRAFRAVAAAKVNLALVVGPRRGDGLHEVATVLQRVDVCDRLELSPAPGLTVEGFADDTIVARALSELAREARVEPAWRVRITKEIPVAAGLGGGSADAAAALRLGNAALPEPLGPDRLHGLAASLGADVPFFLEPGPKLAEGAGERLTPLELPQDFWVVVVLPSGATKDSTGAVYRAFDDREGAAGYEERRAALLDGLARVRRPRDLALLPPNDLASSPLADELREAGAFRADVTGAGPAVYGLFTRRADAAAATDAMRARGRVWLTVPAWYG